MQEGYIKLHRCILDSSWSRQPDFVAVWVYCLLRANYNPADIVTRGGMMVHLEPGQFITSREQISINTGVQESKVERILKVFKSEQQIEQQNKGKFRVISITNWQKYQAREQQVEQQMNNKRTTDEQQMNTNKKEKKEKNDKKEEVKTNSDKPETKRLPICEAWKSYLLMRQKIRKPVTDKGMELAVMKLASLQSSGNDPVAVLNQSIFNSWQGLFPLKEDNNGRQGTTGSAKAAGRKAGIIEANSPDTDWLGS